MHLMLQPEIIVDKNFNEKKSYLYLKALELFFISNVGFDYATLIQTVVCSLLSFIFRKLLIKTNCF